MKYQLDLTNQQEVLVVTDWHRATLPVYRVIRKAKELGVKTIIHCGDLGYNFNNIHNNLFEKTLSKELKNSDLQMIWLDGNHDNQPWLNSLKTLDNGFKRTGKSNRLFYAPRGQRWQMAGRNLGALGGAITVNAFKYKEGITVFKDEQDVTDENVEALGYEKLDVLFTHEAPQGTQLENTLKLTDKDVINTSLTRDRILKAVHNTKPELVISGHWHEYENNEIIHENGFITKTQILKHEFYNNSAILLNLETLDYKVVI